MKSQFSNQMDLGVYEHCINYLYIHAIQLLAVVRKCIISSVHSGWVLVRSRVQCSWLCGREMDGESAWRGSGPSGTTECVKGKGVLPSEGRLIGVKYSPE